MGWIYKVTNQVNGKVYIGKTEYSNPFKRWTKHLEDSKRIDCENRPFYKAINKYGPENFKFEPIDFTDDSDKLCELETYYIYLYRSYVHFDDCNGYNCTLGGDGRQTNDLNGHDVAEHYFKNKMSIAKTAKHFGCDDAVIKRILVNCGVQTLSLKDYKRKEYIETYGGLVQIASDKSKIVNIFECPQDVYELFPDYKTKGLSDAYRLHHKTHKYKNFIWYRLNELPEEYKPLLEEYYES